MTKQILALDLGSYSAFAWTDLDGGRWVDSIKFNAGRETTALTLGRLKMERPEILGLFLLELQRRLASHKSIGKPFDAVVYERPFARGQAATRLLWGMAGIIEALAHDYGAAVLDPTPSEIKKWAATCGGADKDAMILAANFLGYDGDNEHEADAWCLLHYAIADLEFS